MLVRFEDKVIITEVNTTSDLPALVKLAVELVERHVLDQVRNEDTRIEIKFSFGKES